MTGLDEALAVVIATLVPHPARPSPESSVSSQESPFSSVWSMSPLPHAAAFPQPDPATAPATAPEGPAHA